MTSWIQLFAQTGDTIKCYRAPELRKIAQGLIRKNYCDSLLKITEQEVTTLRTVITVKDLIINNNNQVSSLQLSQITTLEDRVTKQQHKQQKQKRFMNFLAGSLIISILTNVVLISTR